MALDDNANLVKDMVTAGKTLSQLASYMSMGVTPSRERIMAAQHDFTSASSALEPILKDHDASRAQQRMQQRPRG